MNGTDVINVQTRVPLTRAGTAVILILGFVLLCIIFFGPAFESASFLSRLFIYILALLLSPLAMLASLNFYGHYRLTQSGIEVAKHTLIGRRWILVPWASVQRIKHEEKIRYASDSYMRHVWGIEVKKPITWQNRRIAHIMQMEGPVLLVTSDHSNHDHFIRTVNENARYPIPEDELALFPIVYR